MVCRRHDGAFFNQPSPGRPLRHHANAAPSPRYEYADGASAESQQYGGTDIVTFSGRESEHFGSPAISAAV
jgi:hypothetical protein